MRGVIPSRSLCRLRGVVCVLATTVWCVSVDGGEQKNNSNEMRRHVLHTAFMEALVDVLPVVASITAFASIAKLMDSFGMIQGAAAVVVRQWRAEARV